MRTKLSVLYSLLIIMAITVFSGCTASVASKDFESYIWDINAIDIPEEVRIVGVGEATHGNKEFTQLKTEIFQTLVAKYGFRVFALEGDFGGCQVVNDYILNGTGTAEEAVKAIGFAIYKTEEMLELVEWMRSYNQSVSAAEKLKFYGFDMQRYDHNKNGLLAYIEKVDAQKSTMYKAALSDLNDETVFDQSRDKIQKGLEAIQGIINEMQQNKEQYIAKSSEQEYLLANQFAQCIKENATLRGTNVSYTQTRDQYMAEKVQWILDYEQRNGNNKLYLSGHNGHIEKTSASPAGYTSMGQRLSEAYQQQYYAVGTEFYKNTFLSKDSSSGERKQFSLTHGKSELIKLFLSTDRDTGLLDIKSAMENEQLKKLLLAKHKMGNIGDEFSGFSKLLSFFFTIEMTPADAYDAIIFVRNAMPSTML